MKRNTELLHLSQKNSHHHEFVTGPRAEESPQCGLSLGMSDIPVEDVLSPDLTGYVIELLLKKLRRAHRLSQNIWGQFCEQAHKSPACTFSEH